MLVQDCLSLPNHGRGEIPAAQAGGIRAAIDSGVHSQPEASGGSAPSHQSSTEGSVEDPFSLAKVSHQAIDWLV